MSIPDLARDALRRRSMFNIIEIATGRKLDLVIRKAARSYQHRAERQALACAP
jgi:hypothetical protein